MSNSQKTILSVQGMSCGNCVRHVENALRKLPGVEQVEVSLEANQVVVQHGSGSPSTEELIQAIDDAGYKSQLVSR